MSLYALVHGEEINSKRLLEMLNEVEPLPAIPRYRNCYISRGKICILTRTGGFNREDYEDENHRLTLHPLYCYNRDEKFDETFAEFFYEFPDEHKKELKYLTKKEREERRLKRTERAEKSKCARDDDTTESN